MTLRTGASSKILTARCLQHIWSLGGLRGWPFSTLTSSIATSGTWCALAAAVLVFLLPRSNDILWRQLKLLLSGVVPRTRNRISAVAIEDVIANLLGDDLCPKGLREYAKKLGLKYLIQSAP